MCRLEVTFSKRQPSTEQINATFCWDPLEHTCNTKDSRETDWDPTQRAHFKANEKQIQCPKRMRAWVAFIYSLQYEAKDIPQAHWSARRCVEPTSCILKRDASDHCIKSASFEKLRLFIPSRAWWLAKQRQHENKGVVPPLQSTCGSDQKYFCFECVKVCSNCAKIKLNKIKLRSNSISIQQ